MKEQQFKIKEIIEETYNTKSFVLDFGKEIDYKAGQFISIVHPENKDERRSYSFSSCPKSELPKITVKRIDNGYLSRYLFDQVKIGESFDYAHISGRFYVSKEDLATEHKHFIFFAAGSGITPNIAMIKDLLQKLKASQKIILVYSNSNRKSTIFLEELEALEQAHPEQLKIEWFFSDADNFLRARLNNFWIIDFIKDWTKDYDKDLFQFFLCGPIEYMDTIIISLLTEGFDRSQIRQELFFNPFMEDEELLPPDENDYEAEITLNGKLHHIEVRYPKTIMQAAHDYGIQLPFSCESGQCGTCIAHLEEGELWMSYNEVLTPKDLEKGLRLTCVAHPIHGKVKINYDEVEI